MVKHSILSFCLLGASLILAQPAQVDEARACSTAIAGTFFVGCQMGAEVQGNSGRGVLDNAQSACSALRDCRYTCRMDRTSAKKETNANFKVCKSACRKARRTAEHTGRVVRSPAAMMARRRSVVEPAPSWSLGPRPPGPGERLLVSSIRLRASYIYPS